MKHKLGLAFVLVSLICAGTLCLSMYLVMRHGALTLMQSHLKDAACLAAAMVDADALAKVKTPADKSLPEFVSIQRHLQSLRKQTSNITNVYTLRLSSDGVPVFIVDEPPELGEEGKDSAEVGEKLEDQGGMWAEIMKSPARSRLPHADTFISKDRFGEWLSGFAPIFDSTGEARCFLGVDMKASRVAAINRELGWIAIIAFLAIVPVSLLAGWRLGCRMAAPLIKLRDVAGQAMNFDFDFTDVPVSNDEIGELAAAFKSMQMRLKESSRLLVASEAKFKGIVEGSLNGIMLFSADLRCLSANPGAAGLFGIDDEHQMESRHFSSLWTPDTVAASELNIIHAKAGRRCAYEATLNREGRGRNCSVLVSLNPVKTHGSALEIICVLTDISQLVEARHALESRSEFLRQFMESMPVPVFYKDSSGRYLDCNVAFRLLCGRMKDEIIGSTLAQLVLYSDTGKHLAIEGEILSGRKLSTTYESDFTDYKGVKRHFIVSKAAFKQPSGSIGGLVCAMMDIGDRKRMEEELTHARIAADTANYAKSRFLANVSHEIRTPLNCVIGVLEMLKESKLNEQQKDMVATMEESGRLLVAVISDILDLAKIEAGRLCLEELPCDLNDIAHGISSIFHSQFASRKIEFRFQPMPEKDAWVFCDPNRLRQVIVNLIGNSIKFTSQGHVELKIERLGDKASAEGISRYRFSVSDTGIGISAEKLKAVFDDFIQEDDAATARSHGGSGLGLSICRQLVLLMGGDISVESQKGVGASFSFIIPLKDSSHNAMGSIETPMDSRALAGKTALIIDDHAASAKMLRNMLASFSCASKEANSFSDGLHKFKESPADIVLLDIHLADGSGYDLARELRAFEQEQAIEHAFIVAVSACIDSDVRERCFAAGMNAHLMKPITKRQLASAFAVFKADSQRRENGAS